MDQATSRRALSRQGYRPLGNSRARLVEKLNGDFPRVLVLECEGRIAAPTALVMRIPWIGEALF
jgi:hypothetical protein